eukprot:TRINITY_DN6623_c0_g1_i1.p2 TRINITY_DN6623_c0_g1~~TRINITY_DN6623_c0_g1_i1.p2  ORF type:complete len:460 (-),score=128.17 TRINITY_DN6623_c0_g1_i1:47-1426(-)
MAETHEILFDDPPADTMPGRWSDLNKVIKRRSDGFGGGEMWDPSIDHGDLRVLVIGAGGLGCEILKDLALSGFRDIHVIDMDTIDLSNLNRQFLFRKPDVGKPKASIAAQFVMRRVPNVRVQAHFGKIEDMPDDFYRNFNIVILGLDSIDARRWMNRKLANLIVWEDKGGKFCEADPGTIIPIVDGGSEGFKGSIRVIRHTQTASFNSTEWLYPPAQGVPMCTLETVPRRPEHCVLYIKEKIWDLEKPFGADTKIDGDNEDHVRWIAEKARKRAEDFKIGGVEIDFRFTLGVVKNVIPAIASTNALVAAGCVHEALKMATAASRSLDSFTVFVGNAYDEKGINASVQQLHPEPEDWSVGPPAIVEVGSDWTIGRFVQDGLVGQFETDAGRKLKQPHLFTIYVSTNPNKSIYQRETAVTQENREKRLLDFIDPSDASAYVILSTPELSENWNARIKLRVV